MSAPEVRPFEWVDIEVQGEPQRVRVANLHWADRFGRCNGQGEHAVDAKVLGTLMLRVRYPDPNRGSSREPFDTWARMAASDGYNLTYSHAYGFTQLTVFDHELAGRWWAMVRRTPDGRLQSVETFEVEDD